MRSSPSWKQSESRRNLHVKSRRKQWKSKNSFDYSSNQPFEHSRIVSRKHSPKFTKLPLSQRNLDETSSSSQRFTTITQIKRKSQRRRRHIKLSFSYSKLIDLNDGSLILFFPQVKNLEEGYEYEWSLEKFSNRYYIIKGLLDKYFETNRIPVNIHRSIFILIYHLSLAESLIEWRSILGSTWAVPYRTRVHETFWISLRTRQSS